MLQLLSAVAKLRSYETDPSFSQGLPSKDYGAGGKHCFPITFEVLSGDAALAAYADIEMENMEGSGATAANFSYQGLDITGDLALVSECGLGKNSFVSIEMEIPGYWHSFRCVGTVNWLLERAEQGCFKAGVSFANVNKQNLNLIQAAIDKFGPGQLVN